MARAKVALQSLKLNNCIEQNDSKEKNPYYHFIFSEVVKCCGLTSSIGLKVFEQLIVFVTL